MTRDEFNKHHDLLREKYDNDPIVISAKDKREKALACRWQGHSSYQIAMERGDAIQDQYKQEVKEVWEKYISDLDALQRAFFKVNGIDKQNDATMKALRKMAFNLPSTHS
jgi:hypothetical protein